MEFVQLAVVEGEYLLLLSLVGLSPMLHFISHITCFVFFFVTRCCSSTGCDSGDKCGVCSARQSCGGG